MSNELKPCPFCGGNPRIDTEYDMDGFGNFHKVECSDCGASSKAHFCTQGNECPQYYQEVRDEWQNRADDALTAEVERLTKIIEKDIQLYPVLKSLVNDEEAHNDYSK